MPVSASTVLQLATLVPYADPDAARQLAVRIAPSLTIPRGTVLGELTASPMVFRPYNAGNTDGSQLAKGILAYDVQTDAGGNITLTQLQIQIGPIAPTVPSVGMYYRGTFNCTDLRGLDLNALNQLMGRLVQGNLTSGIVVFG